MACVAFWLVSALFLGIGAIAANGSGEEAEAGFVGRIGDERAARGLAGYVVAPDLVDVARRHAEEMRRQQRLHHNPRLGDDVQGWQAVGENVGVGPSVEAIHQKLMESPSHRDNILSGRFTEVGVGVVVDGADLWVVQVFRLPRAAASSEPAPAASSEPASPPPSGSTEPSSPPPSPREPRPAPAATPGPAAAVRAASSGAGGDGGGSPSSTAPAPSTTVTTVSAETAGAISVAEVPTTFAEPVTPPVAAVAADGSAVEPVPSPPSTVSETDARSSSPRDVTWPVAVAATMLLGVVAGLLVHVGGSQVRSVAKTGRRPSLVDVWELALAG